MFIYIYILNSKIKLFFILQTCVDQPLVQDGSLLQMPDLPENASSTGSWSRINRDLPKAERNLWVQYCRKHSLKHKSTKHMQKVAVLKKTTLQDRIIISHAYLYNYYILLNVMKKLNYTSLFLCFY